MQGSAFFIKGEDRMDHDGLYPDFKSYTGLTR